MKKWFWIILFSILPIPWVIIRLSGHFEHLHAFHVAILSGTAIVSASFLLSWVGEVAQKDIPQAMALAAVAIIAVLPEYAVDMYFAWKAGQDPQYGHYALANMTGGNRLLIGLGWSLIVFLHCFKRKTTHVTIDKSRSLEIFCLIVASLIAFTTVFTGQINLIYAVIFLALFVFYIYHAGKCQVIEPEIHGPQEVLANLEDAKRKTVLVLFLIFCGFIIFISAEPFAESLIHSGKVLGVDEFLLVQWLAPLASESPEFIVASIFVLNGFTTAGIGCLISSKVNQWTLLVGMIPIAMSLSAGHVNALHLDPRQTEELLLTTAQSIMAIAIIMDFKFTLTEAIMIFLMFVTQFFITGEHARIVYSWVYLAMSVIIIGLDKDRRQNFMLLFSFMKNNQSTKLESK